MMLQLPAPRQSIVQPPPAHVRFTDPGPVAVTVHFPSGQAKLQLPELEHWKEHPPPMHWRSQEPAVLHAPHAEPVVHSVLDVLAHAEMARVAAESRAKMVLSDMSASGEELEHSPCHRRVAANARVSRRFRPPPRQR